MGWGAQIRMDADQGQRMGEEHEKLFASLKKIPEL